MLELALDPGTQKELIKKKKKGIYVLNNWIFSLEGWRRLLLEALQKYIATFIL
jgi:hypothetical protein